MATPWVYTIWKRGDKETASGKEHLGIKHGMLVCWIDVDEYPAVLSEWMRKCFVCMRTKRELLPKLIAGCMANQNPEDGVVDPKTYLPRMLSLDIADVATKLDMGRLAADMETEKAIDIIDGTSLGELSFKVPTPTKQTALDVMAVSTGSFLTGPAATDDYATFAAAYADIANLTGDLTFTLNGDVTEVAAAAITEDLGGFTFATTSSSTPLGDATAGYLLSLNHIVDHFSIQCEGPGSFDLGNMRIRRTGATDGNADSFVSVLNVVAEFNGAIHRLVCDHNSQRGQHVRITSNVPIFHIYTNMLYGGLPAAGSTTGLAPVDVHANTIIENNVGLGMTKGLSGLAVAFTARRNAFYNNTVDIDNIGAATGTDNYDSDGTAADANWSTGTLNRTGLVAADFESVTAADGATYLRPVAGGVLAATAPFTAIAANTMDAAGILWADGGWYVGAKSRPVPATTTNFVGTMAGAAGAAGGAGM